MPQLHLYIPEKIANAVRARARSRGKSLSGYLADLVRGEFAEKWPNSYFKRVVGGWKGRPIERPPQGRLEKRERL